MRCHPPWLVTSFCAFLAIVGLATLSFTTSWAAETNLDAHLVYQASSYLLGPGDVLRLHVLNEPEYTQDNILVRPDGRITLDGIGDLSVNGRSLKELTDQVKAQLSEILVNPQVSIALTHSRPAIVYLHGAVQRPGMFQFNTSSSDNTFHVNSSDTSARTELRVSNVLSNAGGVQMNADLSHIQVTHTNTGSNVQIDFWKVLREGQVEEDVILQPGDVIYIPEGPSIAANDEDYELLLRSSIGPKTFPVRLIGEVKNPGIYHLEGSSPLLNSALSMAGGYAPQASRNVVAIRRFTGEGKFSTIFVDANKLDITLRPNDVLFIPEDRLYKSGRIMEQVAKVFSPFQAVGTTAAGSAQVFGIGGWRRRF